MIEQKSQILFEENIFIKGNEPFIWQGPCGVIVNLNAGLCGSHNVVEKFGAHVPTNQLKPGDTFQIQLVRVYPGKVVWKQKIEQVWSWMKGLKK